MSEAANHQVGTERNPSGAQQVLRWARCHPGMLVVGSLAVAALLVKTNVATESAAPLPPRTAADFLDGETPLFI